MMCSLAGHLVRVEALPAAGQHLDLDYPNALHALERFEHSDDLNHLSWYTWDDVAARLSLPDLILLTQLFTVPQREFRWCGGSVAAAIWLFKSVERREPRVAALLAEWIVPRTTNECLPTGRLGDRAERRAAGS
jgi:hypothetical protein